MLSRILIVLFGILLVATVMPAANAAPVHDAAENGDMLKLRAIVKTDASLVNSTDEYGWTPLQLASQNGRVRAVEFLINSKAALDTSNENWGTALHVAANATIARLLVAAGANTSITCAVYCTPLYSAIVDDRSDVVGFLRGKATTLNVFEAAALGDTRRTAQLLESDPQLIKARDESGRTLLHMAGNAATARLLMAKGAKTNAITDYDSYPILEAAGYGHTDVVEVLLKSGVNIETWGQLGGSPLYEAVEGGKLDTVKFLLRKGANPNATMGEGICILQSVTDTVIAAQLIQYGADANWRDEFGGTPLHNAAIYGRDGIAKLLVEKGAKVNARDDNGYTPLHEAAVSGSRSIAALLVSKGADINAKTTRASTRRGSKKGETVSIPEGSTPVEAAVICKHEEVVNLLQASGARVD